ncbi:MAG: hypothetical protein ACRCWW_08710 [Scandinavium sp.]|uniref:hypothetical protein n=1 Tax=Scandinavium sp. TaxID=2830653 RepID=UPI003F318C69
MTYRNTRRLKRDVADTGQKVVSERYCHSRQLSVWWWMLFSVMAVLMLLSVGFKSAYSLVENVLSHPDIVYAYTFYSPLTTLLFHSSSVLLLMVYFSASSGRYSIVALFPDLSFLYVESPYWTRRGFRRLHLDTEPILQG